MVAVALCGYTFSHAQIELFLAVVGCFFGVMVLGGVVARSTKLIVIGLVVAGLAFLWWYGMTNGWLDGRLGPPA